MDAFPMPSCADVDLAHLIYRERKLREFLYRAAIVLVVLGSILFFVAGLAAFTRPLTESVVNLDVANWGTFGGAVCFAVGGFLQALERPPPAPSAARAG